MKTPARPPRSLPMPLWLQGAVELALVAAVSYLAVVLLLAAVWYTNGFDNSTILGATSVAGHMWLLVHGVPLSMNIPEQGTFLAVTGTMSLMPLGLTLIPLLLCYRSGRRLARASYEGQFFQPLTGGLLAYALVSLGISVFSASSYFSTAPVAAALTPLWVALLGVLAGGYAESRSLAAMIGVNAADWVKRFSQYSRWAGSYAWALVRAATISVLALIAGGALLLALTLFWHWDSVLSLYQSLHAGAVGGTALTLLQLGLILNFVVFAMAWSTGAGFALGTGTSVDLTGTDVGVMPALPILGALPHAFYPLGLLALAVPLAAGAVGGWWFFREGENHLDEWFALKIRFRWISWPLSTLCFALLSLLPVFLLTAFLGWVSNGSLGLGRFTDIGPHPLLFGLYAAVLLAVGAVLGLGLAHLLVRDTSGELDRFADSSPAARRAARKQAKQERKAARAKKRRAGSSPSETAVSETEDPATSETETETESEPGVAALALSRILAEPDPKEATEDTAENPAEEEAEDGAKTSEDTEAESAAETSQASETEPADPLDAGEETAEETEEVEVEEPKKIFRPVIKRPKSRRNR